MSNVKAVAGQGYKVVVGIDFDGPSEDAFESAAALVLGRPEAELHVAHVIRESKVGSNRTAAIDRANAELAATPARLREYVRAKVLAVEALGAAKTTLHARLGTPAEGLVQLAADIDADMIVVGTHGRRGIERMVLGSVAARLLEIAPCPVLVARRRNFAGVERSPHAEPVCAECAAARAASDGATQWCEYHARPQVRPHAYGYAEAQGVGAHDPGIITPGS
jgi:nucleotide-binding universal stress UspA family protein